MNITTANQVTLGPVKDPPYLKKPVLSVIPAEVYQSRLQRLICRLEEDSLDALLIYADKEHCGNFEYICGFDPRYEEALLIVLRNGTSHVLLGNECFSLHTLSKIPLVPHLFQLFSLPSQPMGQTCDTTAALRDAGISEGQKIGVCGWKLFPNHVSPEGRFDIPHYIVKSLQEITGATGAVIEANRTMVGPDIGLRTTNEAEQIAVFEYGASLASLGMLKCLNHLTVGLSEIECCEHLNSYGNPMNSHVMFSSGVRTLASLVGPSEKPLALGDPVVFSLSLRGGLTCRAGYLVEDENQIPRHAKGYLENVVKPYFAAAATWLENISIGMCGGDIYHMMEELFPQKTHGWTLNPGHLTGTEEWLSSPIYPNSPVRLKSGQIVQLDIIPETLPDKFTSNIEDGILLADSALQLELSKKFPDLWERMKLRKAYLHQEIGILLGSEVFPMSDTLGLLRPLLLNHTLGMKKL